MRLSTAIQSRVVMSLALGENTGVQTANQHGFLLRGRIKAKIWRAWIAQGLTLSGAFERELDTELYVVDRGKEAYPSTRQRSATTHPSNGLPTRAERRAATRSSSARSRALDAAPDAPAPHEPAGYHGSAMSRRKAAIRDVVGSAGITNARASCARWGGRCSRRFVALVSMRASHGNRRRVEGRAQPR